MQRVLSTNRERIDIQSVRVEQEQSLVLHERIQAIRSQINTSRSVAVADDQVDCKLHSAENRLHDWLVRFNQIMAANNHTKEQIELLRKEKGIFHSIRSRMQRELEAKEDELAGLIEKSNSAYAARDAALAQITQLKEQADKEHAEFEKEWNELAMLIENDKRMRDFIHQRELIRKRTEAERKALMLESHAIAHPATPVDISVLKSRVTELHENFEAIRAATGISGMEQLLLFFVEMEKSNFSLFNKSNINMKDIESEETFAQSIRQDISLYRGGGISALPQEPLAHANSSLRSPFTPSPEDGNETRRIETMVTNTDRKTEEISTKTTILYKLVSSIRSGIQSIFESLFTNNTDLATYLSPVVIAASNTTPVGTVTDANVLDYLGAVEIRVSQLMAIFTAHCVPPILKKLTKDPSRSGPGRRSVVSMGPSVRTNALPSNTSAVMYQMMHFRLPSAAEDEADAEDARRGGRDENDVTRPLTHSELRTKTLEHIQRQQERTKLKRSNSQFART